MMRKNNIMIPKPRSNFLAVQCTECEEKRVVFTHTTTDVYCKSCGQLIAKKTSAKANILGKVLGILD
jgi:small subunit ribosomal protein S27e